MFCLASCDQYKLANSASGDLSSYNLTNCTYVRNASGQIVSWKNAVPIEFSITAHVPQEWRNVIRQAAKVWTNQEGMQLIRIKDEISNLENPQFDNKNMIFWIDSGQLFNYQQAQTITRWTKAQIQDADVLINSKDFSFFEDEAKDNFKIHLRSLLIHEFGHALGLSHVLVTESVMYPELSFLQIRTDLGIMDQTSMKCEYP